MEKWTASAMQVARKATAALLMDRDTLLAHRVMWTSEAAPLVAELDRLPPAEAELYSDLRFPT